MLNSINQFSSVTQLCPNLCDLMDCNTPDFPVHLLLELAQTHVHRVSDAIQPSHPLSSPSPPTFSLTQHQGLLQGVIWPPDAKNWLIERPWCWKRLKVGGGEDIRGWDGCMASLTRWTWVWVTPGDGDGQGGLVWCSPWGHKESDTTEWLNWTEP